MLFALETYLYRWYFASHASRSRTDGISRHMLLSLEPIYTDGISRHMLLALEPIYTDGISLHMLLALETSFCHGSMLYCLFFAHICKINVIVSVSHEDWDES